MASFDPAKGQNPENLVVGRDGTVYVTWLFAHSVVAVRPDGSQAAVSLPAGEATGVAIDPRHPGHLTVALISQDPGSTGIWTVPFSAFAGHGTPGRAGDHQPRQLRCPGADRPGRRSHPGASTIAWLRRKTPQRAGPSRKPVTAEFTTPHHERNHRDERPCKPSAAPRTARQSPAPAISSRPSWPAGCRRLLAGRGGTGSRGQPADQQPAHHRPP